MINYCGDCVKFDRNQKECWGNRYYCTEKCKYKEPNDKACYSFIKKSEAGYKPSGCFITTVICEMLGYQDNCDILETLRGFRDHYLKNTNEGRKLLQEYDIIGPVISKELAQCTKIDALMIVQKYIIPCYDYIKHNYYYDAIFTYINMVRELKIRFSYAFDNSQIDYNLVSSEEDLGKGRIRLNPANV